MVLFFKNMLYSSHCKKAFSSLFRAQQTGNSNSVVKVPQYLDVAKFSQTRATNLTGFSSVGQYQISAIKNTNIINQISCEVRIRNLYSYSAFISNHQSAHNPYWVPTKQFHSCIKRNTDNVTNDKKPVEKSENLIIKLKQMLKQYWYIYIPVHGITSIMWICSIYYIFKCGFDIKPYLEKIPWLMEKFENSKTGYFALSVALYKIISPIRYTVTVGGIAMSVKELKKRGFIEDNDITKQELKNIYQAKKGKLIDKTDQMRISYRSKKFQLIRRYYRKTEELKIKNRKGLKYLREMYSRGRKDIKKKTGYVRKNGNGSKNGNSCSRNSVRNGSQIKDGNSCSRNSVRNGSQIKNGNGR